MPDFPPIVKKKRNRRKKEFNRKKKAAYFRAIFRRFCFLVRKKGPGRLSVMEAYGDHVDVLSHRLD